MTTRDASRVSSRAQPDEVGFPIRNERFRAVFHPVEGGRLGRLRHVHHGELIVPFTPEGFDPNVWPKSGAFPLFPFHNKLRTAAFEHQGRLVRLRPTMADGAGVMHGPAHRRAWSVSDHRADHVTLELDYRADADWPFDFRATQRFALHQNRLTVTLCLTNTGRDTMPGGLGWHPYFRASDNGVIGLQAARRWTPFDPAAPAADGPVAASVQLDAGRTEHYSGWTRATAVIGDGARISLQGNGALTCFAALHKADYLCLEPVSHVAGALESPGADTGLRHLAPGESLTGTAILSVD